MSGWYSIRILKHPASKNITLVLFGEQDKFGVLLIVVQKSFLQSIQLNVIPQLQRSSIRLSIWLLSSDCKSSQSWTLNPNKISIARYRRPTLRVLFTIVWRYNSKIVFHRSTFPFTEYTKSYIFSKWCPSCQRLKSTSDSRTV